MPSSSHTHKSMLLRGVLLPTPALNSSDIEELKGKTRNSGRSYGGAPLGRHNSDGRRGGNKYTPDPRRDQNRRPPSQYTNGGGYSTFPGPPPMIPPGWAPPPPGFPGFGSGIPPPPTTSHGGDLYNVRRHAPPGVPSQQDYGQQYNSSSFGHQGQNRRPYDDRRGQGGGRGHGYR